MDEGKSKKRKRDIVIHQNGNEVDTAKPSAVFAPTGGRKHTLSIALPGSIIANAQTHDLKTALAAQIARAAAVFCVDEIVIFDDGQAPRRPSEAGGYSAFSDPNFFIYHVLSYLETPPHLRKVLFPLHPDLRTAGSAPSLDMPHHLRSNEWCQYREGATVPGPAIQDDSKAKHKRQKGDLSNDFSSYSLVNCGLDRLVSTPVVMPPNTRVTLDFGSSTQLADFSNENTLDADAVAPETPREKAGYYWGYTIRQASSLSSVFTECPFEGGYDVSVGTSERGVSVSSVLDQKADSFIAPSWSHLLIVFGGVAGLEAALAADAELKAAGVTQVSEIFDRWVNLVPGQGSRTIRTEEAVWLGLMGLQQIVEARNRP